MTLLRVHSLCKAFGGVQAVRGVDFQVERGETVALIGPNGAGKTTCFNMIGGQLPPDAGRIEFKDRDLAGMPPHRIWKLGIGRTFQVAATFSSMTVRENVQMALMSHRRALGRFFSPVRRLYVDEAQELLQTVGMADHADRACGLLAYGDLKRLELALALANEPALLLMDEPTAGVAAGERAELMDLIAHTVRDQGISVLFTEHDMDVVFGYAQRIIVLYRGSVVADGAPEDVRGNARVREVYLGAG
ncbi:MAG: ABC transporter ATP-binding protein [Rhodospirillales bacterium]|jgi:branched-chain amino acid transport system ATP-binding protein|nr:ABC transporter ATP-binding protein [Rhodospirillales bacterium]